VISRGAPDSVTIAGHYRVVISMPGCAAAEACVNYPLKIQSRDSCVYLRELQGTASFIHGDFARSILYARQTLQIGSSGIYF